MYKVRAILSSKGINNNIINQTTIRVFYNLWDDGYLIFYDDSVLIINSYCCGYRLDYVDPGLFDKIIINVADFMGVTI